MLRYPRWTRVCGLMLAAGLSAKSAVGAPPAPLKVVAVLDSTQNFGDTRRSVSFYDVTSLTGGSVFNQQPLFSIWTGYEISSQLNFEDPDTITVNPVNGTLYLSAYDSGPAGVVDSFGDTQGDYDLYKLNYQAALNDYVTNNRPKGTMYAPATGADGAANPQHPQHAGSTINLAGVSQKIGEVAHPVSPDGNFYDYKLQFVDPSKMLMLDNQTGLDSDPDTVANDHQLRFINRVSTAPGAATSAPATGEGGYNSQTTQSWESKSGALIDMDNASGRSEPVTMAYVNRDGVQGVWVGESDGGGDDVSFFNLNFATNTATKVEMKVGPSPYPSGFALDNDPVINPASNDGVIDWIRTDGNGNPLFGESGNFDTPQTEPKVIGRVVTNYNGPDTDGNGQNEIVFGAWSTSPTLAPSIDDDLLVTDGRFVAFDKGTNQVYYFDADSGGQPDVVGDVYVFDLDTGTLVYQEKNAANHFFERQGIEFVMRGDTNGDGLVNATDIDKMFAGVLDPTFGGTVSGAVGQEWFDLTNDGLLTGTGSTGDVTELVTKVLGTAYGDANLDGAVSFGDYLTLQTNFNSPGGWAQGDFSGDGAVSFADFLSLQANFGFNNMVPLVMPQSLELQAVPEPASVIPMGLGLVAMAWRFFRGGRSRRRQS